MLGMSVHSHPLHPTKVIRGCELEGSDTIRSTDRYPDWSTGEWELCTELEGMFARDLGLIGPIIRPVE